jgi:hypothetical protein
MEEGFKLIYCRKEKEANQHGIDGGIRFKETRLPEREDEIED